MLRKAIVRVRWPDTNVGDIPFRMRPKMLTDAFRSEAISENETTDPIHDTLRAIFETGASAVDNSEFRHYRRHEGRQSRRDRQ